MLACLLLPHLHLHVQECGNNMHKLCFGRWADQKRRSGGTVTCVYCRAAWVDDKAVPGEARQAPQHVRTLARCEPAVTLHEKTLPRAPALPLKVPSFGATPRHAAHAAGGPAGASADLSPGGYLNLARYSSELAAGAPSQRQLYGDERAGWITYHQQHPGGARR